MVIIINVNGLKIKDCGVAWGSLPNFHSRQWNKDEKCFLTAMSGVYHE